MKTTNPQKNDNTVRNDNDDDDDALLFSDSQRADRHVGAKTPSAPSQPSPSSFLLRRHSTLDEQANATSELLLDALNDRRSRLSQNVAFVSLLAVNALERFAFYGLICNFILFLNKRPLLWQSYNASLTLLSLFGTSYVSALLGGWLADALLGKYATIALSYALYASGYALFPLLAYDDSAHVPAFCSVMVHNATSTATMSSSSSSSSSHLLATNDLMSFYWRGAEHSSVQSSQSVSGGGAGERSWLSETCALPILAASLLVSVGVGLLKANLGPFGADQVRTRGQLVVFKYFSWLYWCVNLGSLLSLSLLAFIQQNYSFFVGFAIPFAALLLSFVIFLAAKCCYLPSRVADVPIVSNVCANVCEALASSQRRRRRRLRTSSLTNHQTPPGNAIFHPQFVMLLLPT